MEATAKISVIIPCYNSQLTIERTLNSLHINESSNIEVIIIDDGSTDNSLDIINNYISVNNILRDKIKVFSKSNGGVSSARNCGISHATGDYIYFLDSDDTINPDLFKIELNNQDMVIFGYRHEYKNRWKNFIPKFQKDFLMSYLLGKVYINMCSFVIKTHIIKENNLLFDENTFYSEDIEFITKCLFWAKNIHVLTDIFFEYHLNPSSVMHVPRYTERHITSIPAFIRLYNFIPENSYYKKVFLMRIQLEILLQFREYFNKHCKELNLYNLIAQYDCYLSKKSGFKFNRFWGYTYIMKYFYCRFPEFFKILSRVI